MPEQPYTIRGRHVNADALDTIRSAVTTHWDTGRSAISKVLCERWNWRQANGLLKERACRVLLLKLEGKGEISFPPRLKESFRHPKRADRQEYSYDTSLLCGT